MSCTEDLRKPAVIRQAGNCVVTLNGIAPSRGRNSLPGITAKKRSPSVHSGTSARLQA